MLPKMFKENVQANTFTDRMDIMSQESLTSVSGCIVCGLTYDKEGNLLPKFFPILPFFLPLILRTLANPGALLPQALQVTTEGEAPGGPPRDVVVTAVTSSSLRVSWTPPQPAVRHGRILAHYISYGHSGYAPLDQESHDYVC